MYHRIICLLAVVSFFVFSGSSGGQGLPGVSPSPGMAALPIIGFDPAVGQICVGPFGAGPCQAIATFIRSQRLACHGSVEPGICESLDHFLKIQEQVLRITLPIKYTLPNGMPICDGPLGEGPCELVRQYIATQQVAQSVPLQQLGTDNQGRPICAGPEGPGPCDAIRVYLFQQSVSTPLPQNFNVQNLQIVSHNDPVQGPICSGPFGNMPCALLQQMAIDRINGPSPSQSTFNLPTTLGGSTQLALACAQKVGMDVNAFVGCTGQRIVLPRKDQEILDCAVSTTTAPGFASCAADKLGIRLSAEQRITSQCAMKTGGDAPAFAACAAQAGLSHALNDDQRAALQCAASSNNDAVAFGSCIGGRFLSSSQRAVVDCALTSADTGSLVGCAAQFPGISLSDNQRILAPVCTEVKRRSGDVLLLRGD